MIEDIQKALIKKQKGCSNTVVDRIWDQMHRKTDRELTYAKPAILECIETGQIPSSFLSLLTEKQLKDE
jgi:hypothetical protein